MGSCHANLSEEKFYDVVVFGFLDAVRAYDERGDTIYEIPITLMLKNGINMKQIQMMLGHSDYATTANIYSHLDYSDKIPAAKTMEETIYGKDNETV